MKYHKLPGVEKSVCTAEQVIAYNLAFGVSDLLLPQYKNLPTEAAKADARQEAARRALNLWKSGYSYKPGKYDEDSVFCALNAGIAAYLERPFIACGYKEIGETFPAQYLKH